MLDAMQASERLRVTFAAFASMVTWTSGEMVAQLMNNFPWARLRQARTACKFFSLRRHR